MALADVYDALVSKRCYKKAFSHKDACIIIKNDKGRHFDPDVTEVFLRKEEEFEKISESMAD